MHKTYPKKSKNIFQIGFTWIYIRLHKHQTWWYRWDWLIFRGPPRNTRASHLVSNLLSRECLCSLELSEGQAAWWRRILLGASCWAWRNLLTERTRRFAQKSADFEFQPESPGCAEDVFFIVFFHFPISQSVGEATGFVFELGKSMQTPGFNQSLDQIRLARNLQSLTFGDEFNQSLDEVILPINLKSLTFGNNFDQSLRHCKLPIGLQSLAFGQKFNQELEQVALSPEFTEHVFCFVRGFVWKYGPHWSPNIW